MRGFDANANPPNHSRLGDVPNSPASGLGRSRGLGPGDKVEITYDEIVRVRPVRKSVASDDGVTAPAVPVRRPAQPAETDKGGLVGDEVRTPRSRRIRITLPRRESRKNSWTWSAYLDAHSVSERKRRDGPSKVP